jgi:polysaccharide biosynthesis protein PslE
MDPAESRSLRDIAAVLLRHKRKAGLFFVAVMVAVTAYTLFCPRVYRSQAKVFVRLGRENATLDPTATVGQAPVVAGLQSRENEINTAVEILNSRVLLEKVVDEVGPAAILDGGQPQPSGRPDTLSPQASQERYRAITKLTKRLNIEPVKKSNVVAISYDGPSPEIAQTVVAKLVGYYLDRHIELNRTPGAHQFLAEQTARQRAQLTRAEEQLRDLKNETGLIVPEGQRQILVNRMGRLQDELLQTLGALAATEAEVRLLREKLASLSPTHITARTKGVRNEATDNMRGQLYALQLRELESTLKYPEGHPDLKRVRQQAASAKAILVREDQEREQLTEGPDRVYEETQLALLKEEPVLSSLRAKADTLRAQLEQQRTEFKALNENSLRITRLEREFGLQESHYRRYADNLEQAQIDRALEAERISNISVVQPATYDIEPVQPRPLLNFGLGTLLAVLGSVILALQAEHRQRALKVREDAEKQRRIPVLEAMPGLSSSALAVKVGGRNP